MKPLTQFEKMRANRNRLLAWERQMANEARWQAFLGLKQNIGMPDPRQDPVAYFGRALNNSRGQQ